MEVQINIGRIVHTGHAHRSVIQSMGRSEDQLFSSPRPQAEESLHER